MSGRVVRWALCGALIYDPTLADYGQLQANIPTVPFVEANNAILTLNESFIEDIKATSAKCGFDSYLDKYLSYPPPGPQSPSGAYDPKCDIWSEMAAAWFLVNPCQNIYNIADGCPIPNDPLATHPNYKPQVYFNRPDVREAIHAPKNTHHLGPGKINHLVDTNWFECGLAQVFPFVPSGNKTGPEGQVDLSPDPIQHVLPRVIDATQRVLISNGNYDALILTNGSLLAIQNMTWGGELGFQKAPTEDFVVPGQGVMGKAHEERGLMWVESYASGHMQPQYQPRATLRHLEWMLGRIDSL
ncbi:uncharacterized protein LTR77_002227 [Saxophila tyrrhenica]|uniref:Serine carboxypeptidase n=1 Tax=Saxophila tyrrhenica TaxID=1690608 RepID=A0AAV9PML0_9PEZI|nr:hypothetical protein LTR77_002227 [Saxophila tyrrhenica]